ncbi:MAG TPA: sulfite exporter TauE/SafE family protein [Streptosporangiaceae bacterium]
MSLDIVIAGLVVGLLVGMTGAGGGALMTPILILLFGVTPSAAVSSDIVASAIMKPFGGAIHFRKGTVHMGLVAWLSVGSVPAAFAGVFIDHALGSGKVMQQNIEYAMGGAVILAALALVAKLLLDSAGWRKATSGSEEDEPDITVKRVLTVAIGVFGGLAVGITSVGSGSLMIVLLMFLYPQLSMRRLVGTDIVQSMPLVGAAALGHALFGGLQFGLTASITVGSIPGVLIGAWLSSRASNIALRPIVAFVLLATALKLLGLGTTELAVTMGIVAMITLPLWAFIDARVRPADAWGAAGYSRQQVLTLLTVGIPVGVGFVTALVYFNRLRPGLIRAAGQGEAVTAGTTREVAPEPSVSRSPVG